MSTYETTPQNDTACTDPRPRYVPLGTDTAGAHHVYRTADETILVVADGRVTHRLDLGSRSVDDYVRFVREETAREWADRRYLLPGEFGEWIARNVRQIR